jgi:proline dehydrogenase
MVRSAERERLGLKVVRCAYLARETRLVATLGVPSPIHGSIQETHDCYNGCAAFLLGRVRRGTASVMLATHNVQSGQLAAARAQELGIPRGDRNLQFAQLMGVADGLSLSLRNAGFQVSMYLPYGPVEQIIPLTDLWTAVPQSCACRQRTTRRSRRPRRRRLRPSAWIPSPAICGGQVK